MEFADGKCYLCGKEFGNKKPKEATRVEEPYMVNTRLVDFVAPCPFCGKDVPLWEPWEPGQAEPGPGLEPEPAEPEPET